MPNPEETISSALTHALNSAIDAGYAGGGFMLGTGSAPVRQKRRPGRRLVDFAADILWRWP
jgi:hypothetical protein